MTRSLPEGKECRLKWNIAVTHDVLVDRVCATLSSLDSATFISYYKRYIFDE